MRDLNEIIQVHIDKFISKGKTMGIDYNDPKNQISMRAKAKEIGAKVQGLYGPYKPTFDCVRLAYPDYKNIIMEWFFKGAVPHKFHFFDR
jgi:hypothetical protein